MGGPTRTPLQDTVHKMAMLTSARWGNPPALASTRRGSSRGRVALTASATVAFGMAAHWGWLPFL